MVRIASFVVVSMLVALTGCAGSQKAASSSVTPCDYSPAPGETQMSFGDSVKETSANRGDVATSYRPNAQERPTKGAVHAAVN